MINEYIIIGNEYVYEIWFRKLLLLLKEIPLQDFICSIVLTAHWGVARMNVKKLNIPKFLNTNFRII